MSAPTQLVKGNTAVLILSCLAREPMHGYRMVKELQLQSEGYFEMGEGTLYPHLHRLEQDGFIEGYWETTESGRERKCYRITDKGTAELTRRREEWRKFQKNVNRILDLAPEGPTV